MGCRAWGKQKGRGPVSGNLEGGMQGGGWRHPSWMAELRALVLIPHHFPRWALPRPSLDSVVKWNE